MLAHEDVAWRSGYLFARTVAVGLDFSITYFKVDSSTWQDVENEAFDDFFSWGFSRIPFFLAIYSVVQDPLLNSAWISYFF